ncbi:MAG TPA: hypothetical protein VK446_03780 [Methylocystis sp.]|nr:hypothetical protein [Methylocystis sp.]
MKTVIFALAFCFVAGTVRAHEAVGSTPPPAAPPVDAATQALEDVTGSVRCKKVVVELDEGYGVSSHETRTVCAPRAEN